MLIEVSELIGSGYDLSNTQDGLCWKNGIYISSPRDKNSDERSRVLRPSSCCIDV